TAEGIIREATDKPIGLDAVYAALMRPPIGLKEGAIPVLLTALLLAHGEDIALYQEGTYQPVITADLLERLVKSPARFSARHFSTQGGQARVIAAVAAAVETVTGRQINSPAPGARARGGGRRNTALLSVVSPLLAFARGLPGYTLRTHRLASDAEAVRDALLTSRQPDHLLFEALPQACGLEAFRPGARSRAEDIATLQERLTAALDELRSSYAELLEEIGENLSAELRLSE